MKLFGKEYEDRFGFMGSQYDDQILLERRASEISLSDLAKKKQNFIIFTTDPLIRELEKMFGDKVKAYRGGNGRILGLEFKTLLFKNFNAICGYSSFEDLREKFEWDTDNEAELMRLYINFLHSKKGGMGLKRTTIAMAGRSYIAEAALYKGLSGEIFYISNNALPKTEKERRAVFNYYKNKLMEKSGKIYGILECEPGGYENVLRIDLGNFYGYLQCVQKFLSNNPYQVLTGKAAPIYDYLPIAYREKIIHNYSVANMKDENGKYIYPKGVRQFHKDMNNLTPGRSENLDIYLKRTRTRTAGFLQPQHGFEIVSAGIDYLEAYTDIFRQCGAKIICRDTDSIKLTGLTREQGQRVVDLINEGVVQSLINAGFTEEQANCGIGQFKVEGYSKRYHQFADKAYCFTNDKDEIEITFAGMGKKEKQKLLSTNPSFDDVVKQLEKRQTQILMPIEVNGKYDIIFNGGF